jgi:serine/threonine-protein kinase
VSLWSKLFRRSNVDSSDSPLPTSHPPAHKSPPPSDNDEIALLSRFGTEDGPDEATADRLLHIALTTPRQQKAIDAIAHAMMHHEVPERLRLVCAHTLVQRGEIPRALLFLDSVSQTPSLMLKADLLHDQGNVASALSIIERVLARDLDTPGARERHRRWRAQLAPHLPISQDSRDVTVAVPNAQQSPYRIVREIARGGAGTVYEARDDILQRSLALKVYHQSSDQEQLQREAQIAIQLAGEGIIRIFDIDLNGGWIALEWLPRGSVREAIRRAHIDALGEPSSFIHKLALTLSHVHERGWVHADLKPGNILLDASAAPILSDFGIAVRCGEPNRGGSTGYLSPERLAGAPVEPSDDIYALGRILEDIIRTEHHAWSPWLSLAEHCMTERSTRPRNGQALLALLRP